MPTTVGAFEFATSDVKNGLLEVGDAGVSEGVIRTLNQMNSELWVLAKLTCRIGE